MPLFAFCEQWFDPHLALVERFLVGEGLLVAFHSFDILSKKGAVDVPAMLAFGTLRFQRASIADGRIGAILGLLCPFHSICWTQDVPLRTAVHILVSVVGKLCEPIIAHVVLASLGDGDVRSDMSCFDSFEVLSCSIEAVGSHLFGPQMPTKACMPEQVLHGMIVHYLPRSDEHRQNDAAFASIDYIVRMIAQMGSTCLETHRCCVRIGRADPKIGRALIGATNLSLLSPFLCDPVMPRCILCCQFLTLCLRKDSRQKCGFRAGRDF